MLTLLLSQSPKLDLQKITRIGERGCVAGDGNQRRDSFLYTLCFSSALRKSFKYFKKVRDWSYSHLTTSHFSTDASSSLCWTQTEWEQVQAVPFTDDHCPPPDQSIPFTRGVITIPQPADPTHQLFTEVKLVQCTEGSLRTTAFSICYPILCLQHPYKIGTIHICPS